MNSYPKSTNHTDVLGRTFVRIDLTQPFEQVVATALALPHSHKPVEDKQIVNATREVYEAVHGRSIETAVGRISIAPGICPWAVVRQLEATTRDDFLVAVRQWLARVGAARGVIAGRDFSIAQQLPNAGPTNALDDEHRPRTSFGRTAQHPKSANRASFPTPSRRIKETVSV